MRSLCVGFGWSHPSLSYTHSRTLFPHLPSPPQAGLGASSKIIDVDALEKMGGGAKGKVKECKTEGEFAKALKAAGKKLVVVDFFATWCGPCKQIAPQFAELSGSYGSKVKFLKVDVDKAKSLSQKYQVSSMPTFLFLKNGKQLDKLAGANIDAIKQKISSLQ